MKPGSPLAVEGTGADAAMLTQEIKAPTSVGGEAAIIQEVEEENNPEEGGPED